MEINAVTFRLLALLEDAKSGQSALEALAEELQYDDPAQLMQFGGELLKQLREATILAGTALS